MKNTDVFDSLIECGYSSGQAENILETVNNDNADEICEGIENLRGTAAEASRKVMAYTKAKAKEASRQVREYASYKINDARSRTRNRRLIAQLIPVQYYVPGLGECEYTRKIIQRGEEMARHGFSLSYIYNTLFSGNSEAFKYVKKDLKSDRFFENHFMAVLYKIENEARREERGSISKNNVLKKILG